MNGHKEPYRGDTYRVRIVVASTTIRVVHDVRRPQILRSRNSDARARV